MSVEESPEFKAALENACGQNQRNWLYGGGYAKANSKDEIPSTMEEIDRRRKGLEAEAQRYRVMADPYMKEITRNIQRRDGWEGLVCPVCGEGDNGNRLNNKPYCFMNAKHKGIGPIPLMSPEKAKEWKPPKKRSTDKLLGDLPRDQVAIGRVKR